LENKSQKLEYEENSNFNSGHFLTDIFLSIMIGFKLNLLRKIVSSLKFYNAVILDIRARQKVKESFYAVACDSSNLLSKLLYKSYYNKKD
jgi:hypothetical protein